MPKKDITELLAAFCHGEKGVEDQLLIGIYPELHRIAEALMRRERPGHMLQPTALVNEVYLRVVRSVFGKTDVAFEDRRRFLALVAKKMREILVDEARARDAIKRFGGKTVVSLSDVDVPAPAIEVDLIALDEALLKLEQEDPRAAKVVELRYFADFSIDDVSQVLEIAPATVKRDWVFARARLLEILESTSAEKT